MAALASTAPQLTFDEDELRRWGYMWRVGTKSRKATPVEDDEPEGEAGASGDPSSQDQVLEAVANALGEAGGASITGVIDLNRPMTAMEAGVPADWLTHVDEASYPSAFSKKQGMDFGLTFDRSVGKAFSEMLGAIPVVEYKAASSLLPPQPDCVEVGPARVIGGVRPQNFDVAYRPDGVRIAYDSKTLNDQSSIQKNWQNMVNDLGTEATTVHTRFPYAIVAFLVAVPKPALRKSQQADLIRTLERLATREHVIDQNHLAEAIALVVWDPVTGRIDSTVPDSTSPLRYENFMSKIYRCYVERYKGLPPHDK